MGNRAGVQRNNNTDYAAGIFRGTNYGSQEAAVLAAAKTYAKQDYETIKTINMLFDLNIAPEQLVAAKKHIIEMSIEKRDETPDAFVI